MDRHHIQIVFNPSEQVWVITAAQNVSHMSPDEFQAEVKKFLAISPTTMPGEDVRFGPLSFKGVDRRSLARFQDYLSMLVEGYESHS